MLMKGVKKCGLLSAFFIIFGLSLVVSLDVNATYHEFVSVPLGSFSKPSSSQCFIFNNTTSRYEFNPDYINCDFSTSYNFILSFTGDAYNSSLWDNLGPASSLSVVNQASILNDDRCYLTDLSGSVIKPILRFSTNPNYGYMVSAGGFSSDERFRFDFPLSQNRGCYHRSEYGHDLQGNTPDLSGLSGLLTCNRDNGAVCDGLWDSRNYVNNEIFPYWYGQDALYLQNSYKSDDGIRYSNIFSFNDLFNKPIHKFSHLTIPLNDIDEYYFYNPDNLYSGRSFEIRGTFDFKGSFTWHDNISTNGSYFRLYYRGWSASSNSSISEHYVDCNTNLITLSANNTTQLQYSCPFNLSDDYSYLDLSLQIDGNGSYVWQTDDEWFFYTTALISDNNDTKGRPFGKNVTGGASKKIGSAQNNANSSNNAIIIDNVNFSQSLIQLFGFSFLNPFAPLLQMFSDNNQCVQIPTLAGLIHSESSEVCPWFNSSVRNISTPVLSISSMMLIFGFAVRWLGSRSGNFIEDSDSHESGGIIVGKRGRK